MRLLIPAFLLAGMMSAHAADLALKRVMLSSAGVGYFEYEATVDRPATFGLDVPLDQVDDVLMSLVVFDSQGGVGTVELPGHDTAHASFADVPFGPDALRSPLDTLNQLQGVEVAVQGLRPMTGRIVQAERVMEAQPTLPGRPPALVQRTRVTLLSPQGIQQFLLEDVDSMQVTDQALRNRIDRAVASLRREASQSVRHITLRSGGNGHRTVRVGYVAGAPLWKTSYRLVLPATDGEPARLQGWAVLENQSGTEWNDVALTLQYGNPVTFRQAIYRSYFVQRPDVPVEILGRILPDVDTRARAMEKAASAPAPAQFRAGNRAALAAPAAAAPPAEVGIAEPLDRVQATEQAEETVFQLPMPVTLAAGHTASVPIIDRTVPAERIDLATGDAAHPLAAIRVTNDTGASLPAGVLTLYAKGDAATFAGDARLGGLPAGETRLLSFAQDLRTTVERDRSEQRMLASLTASRGVLHIATRLREVLHVTITAPASAPRRVLVEIRKQDGRALTLEGGPVPDMEETATAWRIPVAMRTNEVRRITAYLDRLQQEQTSLLSDDTRVIVALLNQQDLSPAARGGLQHLVALRQEEAAKHATVAQLKAQQVTVAQDEERIRRNLAVVAPNDALHTRLTHALDADETRLDQLGRALEQAGAEADRAHQAVAEAAAALTL